MWFGLEGGAFGENVLGGVFDVAKIDGLDAHCEGQEGEERDGREEMHFFFFDRRFPCSSVWESDGESFLLMMYLFVCSFRMLGTYIYIHTLSPFLDVSHFSHVARFTLMP